MRYYEVHYPGETVPDIVTNARHLHDLPEGTRVHAIITERDGSLAETYEIPVVDGRPQIGGRGNRKPKAANRKRF